MCVNIKRKSTIIHLNDNIEQYNHKSKIKKVNDNISNKKEIVINKNKQTYKQIFSYLQNKSSLDEFNKRVKNIFKNKKENSLFCIQGPNGIGKSFVAKNCLIDNGFNVIIINDIKSIETLYNELFDISKKPRKYICGINGYIFDDISINNIKDLSKNDIDNFLFKLNNILEILRKRNILIIFIFTYIKNNISKTIEKNCVSFRLYFNKLNLKYYDNSFIMPRDEEKDKKENKTIEDIKKEEHIFKKKIANDIILNSYTFIEKHITSTNYGKKIGDNIFIRKDDVNCYKTNDLLFKLIKKNRTINFENISDYIDNISEYDILLNKNYEIDNDMMVSLLDRSATKLNKNNEYNWYIDYNKLNNINYLNNTNLNSLKLVTCQKNDKYTNFYLDKMNKLKIEQEKRKISKFI